MVHKLLAMSTSYCALRITGKPLMSRVHQSDFVLNLWCKSYWILNKFVIESKDIRENCLCPLGIVGSSSMHRIWESDFVIFRPKVYEILNFIKKNVIKSSIKIKNSKFKENCNSDHFPFQNWFNLANNIGHLSLH